MKPNIPLRYVLGFSALLAAYSAQAAPQVWDDGGTTGNWNTTDLNWDVGSTWTNGNDAVFGGTAGSTVTINEAAISATGLTFNVNNDIIAQSGGNDLTLASGHIVTVGTGLVATISAPIAGAEGVQVEGGGTLNLTGANTAHGGGDTSLGLIIGATSADNTVNLSSGGTFAGIPSAERRSIGIGNSAFGGNSLVISTPGSVGAPSFTVAGNSGQMNMGSSSSGNSFTINNGAYLNQVSSGGTTTWTIGLNAGANSNSLTVTGAGSTVDSASNHAIVVGGGGSSNTVEVSAGGIIEARRLQLAMNGGDNNTVTIDNGQYTGNFDLVSGSSNSLFEIANSADATGNSVIVQNGGTLFNNGGGNNRNQSVGSQDGANNNSLVVTGVGSSAQITGGSPLSIGGVHNNGTITDSTAANNHVDIFSGASGTFNGVYLQGVNSSFNVGDGTGISVAAVGLSASLATQGIVLAASDSSVNIDSGRLVARTAGNLVSGSGEVVLDGDAYISTAFTSNVTTVITGGGSLTKEDTGLLVLSGANDYTGDTTVADGILSLQSAYLADASTITLLGVLDLDTAGATDDVGALYLGGVLQTLAGTYGSTASGADYQNDTYFSGSGKLQLVPEPGVALLGGLGLLTLLRRRRNA